MGRFKGNPILIPIEDHRWESRYVFNPAAISLGGQIHILYRAMGEDMISRLGYASSSDGYQVDERLPEPVFNPASSLDKYGCEDPRLTVIERKCFMTYTAFGDIYQIGITSIPVENILRNRWEWGQRIYPFPNVKNKNAVIFPRKINGSYVMLHRVDPKIYVAYSHDLWTWTYGNMLMSPRPGMWDCVKVGAAGPPIEVDDGWLLVYHGVDAGKVYRLGVALLEENNPEKVTYRSEEPILEPAADYERFGYVPDVVFSCGSVLLDGQLLVYYGAADTVIGVADYDPNEILP